MNEETRRIEEYKDKVSRRLDVLRLAKLHFAGEIMRRDRPVMEAIASRVPTGRVTRSTRGRQGHSAYMKYLEHVQKQMNKLENKIKELENILKQNFPIIPKNREVSTNISRCH